MKSPRDVELPANVSGDVELRKNLDVAAPLGLDEPTAWFRRFHIRDVSTILLALTGCELARIRGAGTDLSGLLQRLVTILCSNSGSCEVPTDM